MIKIKMGMSEEEISKINKLFKNIRDAWKKPFITSIISRENKYRETSLKLATIISSESTVSVETALHLIETVRLAIRLADLRMVDPRTVIQIRSWEKEDKQIVRVNYPGKGRALEVKAFTDIRIDDVGRVFFVKSGESITLPSGTISIKV